MDDPLVEFRVVDKEYISEKSKKDTKLFIICKSFYYNTKIYIYMCREFTYCPKESVRNAGTKLFKRWV